MMFFGFIVICLGFVLLIMRVTGKFNFHVNLPALNTQLDSASTGLSLIVVGSIIIVTCNLREKGEKDKENLTITR